jgi:hypothetical protein
MSKTDESGPAFPCGYVAYPGLTKREYIATHVLAGLVASRWSPLAGISANPRDTRAEWAVAQADALIAALSEGRS